MRAYVEALRLRRAASNTAEQYSNQRRRCRAGRGRARRRRAGTSRRCYGARARLPASRAARRATRDTRARLGARLEARGRRGVGAPRGRRRERRPETLGRAWISRMRGLRAACGRCAARRIASGISRPRSAAGGPRPPPSRNVSILKRGRATACFRRSRPRERGAGRPQRSIVCGDAAPRAHRDGDGATRSAPRARPWPVRRPVRRRGSEHGQRAHTRARIRRTRIPLPRARRLFPG